MAMPRAFADSLFHHLITAFPPRRAYGPAAFAQAPMPPPVVHFLKRFLQRRLHHEVNHLAWPHGSWFDDDHPDVQQARRAYAEALAHHGHVPADAWESALQQAVEQVTAYLVRPTATLRAFVFQDGEAVVPSATLERRMSYFTGYTYLYDAVRLYVEQKQVTEIDPAHFTRLLQHIDRKVTDGFDADAWLRLLKPLFDFARHHPSAEGAGPPIDLLLAFFAEKGLSSIEDRLRAARDHRQVTALDEDGLRRVLTATPEAPAPAPVPDGDGHPAADAPSAAPPEEAQGPIPRWKQFQQQPRRQPAPPPTRPPAGARTGGPAAAQEAVPRWMQFRKPSAGDGPAAADAAGTPDLNGLEYAVLGATGPRNRDLFVKHLFAGSAADYERVLRRLHAAPNWPEASRIIAAEVFQKNQVNIYSNPAVLFTDAVEAGYGTS